jgi:putative copper export protein
MLQLEPFASGIGYAGSALLLGVLVTAAFLVPGSEPKELRRTLLAWAMSMLLLFLSMAVISLLIQGAKLRPGALPSLDIVLRYVTMTQSGKVWLLREIYGVALVLVLFRLMRHDAGVTAVRIVSFLTLLLIAGRSFASHAIAVKHDTSFAVMADATHLIAGGLWGGGLVALVWTLHYGMKVLTLPLAWAAETVRRFSRLAFVSVMMLLITGLYQSWIQVGNLTILFATAYGRVLALKILLFLAMLSLGALNFLSTGPRLVLASQVENKTDSLLRMALIRIGAESFLALLVFLVTGFLTALPPGVHAVHQAALTNVSPASPGASSIALAEGAAVKILSPTPGQVFANDRVLLSFHLTKGKRGDHVHAYIDGELMGMFISNDGTLNGIRPGRHVLELRVVAEDHQTELDASDRIQFTVKSIEKEKP